MKTDGALSQPVGEVSRHSLTQKITVFRWELAHET